MVYCKLCGDKRGLPETDYARLATCEFCDQEALCTIIDDKELSTPPTPPAALCHECFTEMNGGTVTIPATKFTTEVRECMGCHTTKPCYMVSLGQKKEA